MRTRRRKQRFSPLPLIILIFLLGIGVTLQFLITEKSTREVLSLKAPTPTVTPTIIPLAKVINITYQSIPYTILAFPIEATASVSLIPNFTQKEFPENVASQSNCMVAINGGFYTGANKPLGLFYQDETLTNQYAKSGVANGFFVQTKLGQRFITHLTPTELTGLDFAMQTGPFIKVNPKGLGIINDSRSRRSLLGVDEENKVYLISIRNSNSSFGGPYLSDIPIIFNQQELQQELPLVQILNLDGGSASFFYSSDGENEYTLPALSPVGSVICVKE
jgi:uncharacterized protein YigE (DUF2233 family)